MLTKLEVLAALEAAKAAPVTAAHACGCGRAYVKPRKKTLSAREVSAALSLGRVAVNSRKIERLEGLEPAADNTDALVEAFEALAGHFESNYVP